MKPFCTYPEERAAMLDLIKRMRELRSWDDMRVSLADELADKVEAILEDEQYGIDAKVYGGAK